MFRSGGVEVGAAAAKTGIAPSEVHQLAADHEDDACAGGEHQPASPAREAIQIMRASVDRPEREGVNHRDRLKASLDGE